MVLDGDVQPANQQSGRPRKAFPKRTGTTGAQRFFDVPKIAQALHWDAPPATSVPASSGYVMVPAASHVLQRQPTARSSRHGPADISHRIVVSRIPIESMHTPGPVAPSAPSPSIVSIPNGTTFTGKFFTSTDDQPSPPRLQSSESLTRPTQSKPLISVTVGTDALFPLTPDRDCEASFGSPGIHAWDRDTFSSPIDMSNVSEFLDSVAASEITAGTGKAIGRRIQLSPPPSQTAGPAISVSEAGLHVSNASETPHVPTAEPRPLVVFKRSVSGAGKPVRTSMPVPLSVPLLSDPSPIARSQPGSKLRKQRSDKSVSSQGSGLAILPPLAHSRPAPLTKPSAVSPSKLLSPTQRGSQHGLTRNDSFFSSLVLSPSPVSQYSRASDDSGTLRVSDLPQTLPAVV
jgi:hypothetical protein